MVLPGPDPVSSAMGIFLMVVVGIIYVYTVIFMYEKQKVQESFIRFNKSLRQFRLSSIMKTPVISNYSANERKTDGKHRAKSIIDNIAMDEKDLRSGLKRDTPEKLFRHSTILSPLHETENENKDSMKGKEVEEVDDEEEEDAVVNALLLQGESNQGYSSSVSRLFNEQPTNEDKKKAETKLSSSILDYSNSPLENTSLVSMGLTLRDQSNRIVVLRLSNCDLKDHTAILLSSVFRINKSITTLDLSHNFIEKSGCMAIASSFGRGDLKNFDFALRKVVAPENRSNYHSASFSVNESSSSLRPLPGTIVAAAGGGSTRVGTTASIADTMSPLHVVHSLGNLEEKKPQPLDGPAKSARSRGDSFDSVSTVSSQSSFTKDRFVNTTITSINLLGNCIGPMGAKALALACTTNSSIVSLNLGYQRKGAKIGSLGTTAMSALLRRNNCALRYLSLARNNIGFEGCRHLSSALLVNQSLEELDIGGVNYITIAGALVLGQVLKCNRYTRLAWLTVGEHRLPISVLIGDRMPLIEGIDEADEARRTRMHPISLCVQRTSPRTLNTFTLKTSHGMDDELGVVVATLLSKNRSLQQLCMEHSYLPIQQLLGNDPVVNLTLAHMELTSIDTIIIGSLVGENQKLTRLDLRGNRFAATEGENFVAYALERNLRLHLDTTKWPPATMYAEGYHALATQHGLSASGAAAIEPQRLEGWFYQSLTALSAVLFYFSLVMDIITVVSFANNLKAYHPSWVVILACILCLPTALYGFNATRNLIMDGSLDASLQLFLILFQCLPAIQAYDAISNSMESTAMLDFKYVQATHKSLPQIIFQVYVMFAVGISTGTINYYSLSSVALSMIFIVVIFIMLYDRKVARRMSMVSVDDQPYIGVLVAKIFSFFGMGTENDSVTQFVNFDAYYTAHYCLSYVYQIVGLCPRVICIAWLLACLSAGNRAIVLATLVLVRFFLIAVHDTAAYQRTLFNNIICAISLTITESAWHIDQGNHIKSKALYVGLYLLTTCENLLALYYVFFLYPQPLVPDVVKILIFAFMIVGMGLRWLMLVYWALHVHFPRLYANTNRRSSTWGLLNSTEPSSKNSASPSAKTTRNPTARRNSIDQYEYEMAHDIYGAKATTSSFQYKFGWNPFRSDELV